MKLHKILYIALVIALAVLILALSVVSVFGHHVCAGQDCLICAILKPILNHTVWIDSRWNIPLIMLFLLLEYVRIDLGTRSASTLVEQKVKISS